MNTKPKFLRAIGATAAAAVIVTSASVAFASNQGNARPSGTGINVPTLVLTSNGKPVSTIYGSTKYNDVHFVWQNPRGCAGGFELPPVVLEWTYNGTHIDPLTGAYYQPALAPCRINDFEAGWTQTATTAAGAYRFTYATWTYNGKVIKKVKFPVTANDFELYLLGKGRILKAWWTYNGKPVASIPLPAGVVVNDAHFMIP